MEGEEDANSEVSETSSELGAGLNLPRVASPPPSIYGSDERGPLTGWCVPIGMLLFFIIGIIQFPHPKVDPEREIELFLKDSDLLSDAEKWAIRKERCGEVCETRPEIVQNSPGKLFKRLRKSVDCELLFQDSLINSITHRAPPEIIPRNLLPDFTYHGQLYVKWRYRSSTNRLKNWTMSAIDGPRRHDKATKMVRKVLSTKVNLTMAKVLIIGSQAPWLASLVLKLGASKVMVHDLYRVISENPKVISVGQNEFRKMYLTSTGNMEKFDLILAIDSLESMGMGLEGQPLNPYADLITMAKAWCVAKVDSKAMVVLPVGQDTVHFNTERNYGPILLSHLFANWELEHTSLKNGFDQEGPVRKELLLVRKLEEY